MTEGVRTEMATGLQQATRNEGVTQGFPGSSAFLKALQLPHLGALWLQKGMFLHLTPCRVLQDFGTGQTGVVYTECTPVPGSWDVCEYCHLLVCGYLPSFGFQGNLPGFSTASVLVVIQNRTIHCS